MIHVLATISLAPGKREDFLAEFRQIIPQVHAEQGCIEYGPAVDADTGMDAQHKIGADTVMVIEKWENVAALKAHSTAPHMLEYRGKVKDFVRNTEIRVLDPAG
jgi:quinol monooxygenase YgiN